MTAIGEFKMTGYPHFHFDESWPYATKALTNKRGVQSYHTSNLCSQISIQVEANRHTCPVLGEYYISIITLPLY